MANRKKISAETQRKLFASSGGFCQNPSCLQRLFPEQMGQDRHIAEMAHIIPHGNRGPRHEEKLASSTNVDGYENLILLCPTCHTMVDKDADAYPRSTLLVWKETHLSELAKNQGIKRYETRAEVQSAISLKMSENKAIWRKFAPVDGSCFEYDPESHSATVWPNRMRSVILPNHHHIQSVIEQNMEHATSNEREVYGLYVEHVRGLVERHVCESDAYAITYPKEMDNIFS